jgi:glutathione S-transferase
MMIRSKYITSNTTGLLNAESRAIIRYIANKYAEKGSLLTGKTLEEKARVEQWLEVESGYYNPVVSTIVAEIVFKPRFRGLPTDDKVVEEQLQKLEKVLDIYEAHLAKNEYLAGDFFSLADLSHLPYTHYLINFAKKGDAITSRKHVNAWWERISSRPSWQHALKLANPNPKSD